MSYDLRKNSIFYDMSRDQNKNENKNNNKLKQKIYEVSKIK